MFQTKCLGSEISKGLYEVSLVRVLGVDKNKNKLRGHTSTLARGKKNQNRLGRNMINTSHLNNKSKLISLH